MDFQNQAQTIAMRAFRCHPCLGAILVILSLCSAQSAHAHRVLAQQSMLNAAAAPAAEASTAAAASPSPSRESLQNGNCTPPRTLEDAKQPFCFIPETVSSRARQFLSTAAAGKNFAGSGDFFTDDTALQEIRQFFQVFSMNGSDAAKAQYLKETRNETIAGVPVVFGILKDGTDPTSNPADAKLLIYLHGGGYFIGSCQYQWSTSAPTAARAGLPILCIEYRLAPEHPFPAGLNDVLAVYKELIKQGYQGKNLVLLGDSAGGGLVAAAAVQLQREGVPLPAALGMFSPAVEIGRKLDTTVTMIAVDPVITTAGESFGRAYVGGNETLFADPLVSPARADYAALFPNGTLPPSLIQVGLREILLSDSVQLYHKLKAAAPAPGRVTISPYDAMWHVFQSEFTMPEAQAAAEEMADFYKRAIAGGICSA